MAEALSKRTIRYFLDERGTSHDFGLFQTRERGFKNNRDSSH
jgi:hypothetical protein